MNIDAYLKAGYGKVPNQPYLVHKSRDSVLLISENELITLTNDFLVYKIVKNPITNSIRVLHRLRALAFIPFPKGITEENGVCNHKDGNKLNCDIENLEWVTTSQNNIHAVMTGLKKDNFVGICEDIVLGITYEFYSLQHLSKMIKLHAGLMSRYLKEVRDYPFRNRYNLKVIGKETNHNFTKSDLWKSGPGSPTPVILTHTPTGQKTYWGTFANMVRKMGKQWVHRKKWIPGKIVKFDNGEYQVTIATSWNDIAKGHAENEQWARECYSEIIKYSPPALKISVTDKKGVVKIYESLKSFSDVHGLKFPALKKSVSKKGRYKHFKIAYIKSV